jgi:D-3-phosphoglycerate dehydrogenase
VLVPAGASSPRAEQIFHDAGFELAHGLSAEEARQLEGAAHDVSAVVSKAIQRSFSQHLREASAIQGLAIGTHVAITEEVIEAAPLLEVIFLGAAGYDAVDVDAATRRGVLVVNAPGANAVGVAEHALGMMLSLSHKIAEADRRSHAERAMVSRLALRADPPPLSVLEGCVLGLVGFGHVGRELASRARAFGMTVMVYDPYLPADPSGTTRVDDLNELLAVSDFVSLHVPLTSSTEALIDRDRLRAMKPTAYLINTARGRIVDTAALVEALREREIAGAGLDVTEPEPLPAGHPLFDSPTVVLTPHSAAAADRMIENGRLVAARGAVGVLRGHPGPVVNPAALPIHHAKWCAGPLV